MRPKEVEFAYIATMFGAAGQIKTKLTVHLNFFKVSLCLVWMRLLVQVHIFVVEDVNIVNCWGLLF